MTCVKAAMRGDDVMYVVIDTSGVRQIRGAAWEAIEQGNDDLATEICQTFKRSDADSLDEKLREGLATYVDECVREWDEGPVETLFDTLSDRFAGRGISLDFEMKKGAAFDREHHEAALEDDERTLSPLDETEDSTLSPRTPPKGGDETRRRNTLIGGVVVCFLLVVGIGLWRFHVSATERRLENAIDWASHITKLADSDPARARAITDPSINVNTGTSTWASSIERDRRNDAIIPEPSPAASRVVRADNRPRKLISLSHARWLDARSDVVVVAHEVGDLTDDDYEFALVRVTAPTNEPSRIIAGLDVPSWLRFESDSSIILRTGDGVYRIPLEGGDLSKVAGEVSAFAWDDLSYYAASPVTVVGRKQLVTGRITRLSREGGDGVDLYDSLPPVRALGVHGTDLVFIGREPASPREGRLSYVNGYLARATTSGEGEIDWTFFDTHRPRSIVVSEDAVFMLTEGTLEGHLNDGMVLRIPNDDGDWQVLAAAQPMSEELVRGGDWLCWSSLDTLDYSVRCVSTSGGPVLEVGWGQGQARGVSIDGSRVFWSEGLARSTILVAELPDA